MLFNLRGFIIYLFLRSHHIGEPGKSQSLDGKLRTPNIRFTIPIPYTLYPMPFLIISLDPPSPFWYSYATFHNKGTH